MTRVRTALLYWVLLRYYNSFSLQHSTFSHKFGVNEVSFLIHTWSTTRNNSNCEV